MAKNLFFSTSSELIVVPSDAVVFIKADGNYSSITMADGGKYVLTMQLGQVEKSISTMVDPNDNRFIRIGKSLIINTEFITYIHLARQRLVLSDSRAFRHEVSASREALKALKDFIENQNQPT